MVRVGSAGMQSSRLTNSVLWTDVGTRTRGTAVQDGSSESTCAVRSGVILET
jgi:hypothetical protein